MPQLHFGICWTTSIIQKTGGEQDEKGFLFHPGNSGCCTYIYCQRSFSISMRFWTLSTRGTRIIAEVDQLGQ
jgi:hypothetical protein